jgi:uncharacterized protein (DUF1697 family)
MKYVALFRGINVGESIRIPMKELKILLEKNGLLNVSTYLNSGNALFESKIGSKEITEFVNDIFSKKYKQHISILIKTAKKIIDIAESIPKDWNNDETQQTYVAYLFPDVAKPSLIDELPIKREYMNIFYKNKCIIWNIKRANYNKSQITKIAGHDSYSRMTTRNSNTARKLAELCL